MMIGIDLIKHKYNIENIQGNEVDNKQPLAVAMTFPLLLDSNNKKFGKSEGNAYFLSPKLTKPYSLYQYLLNLSDDFASTLFSYFSFLPLSQINEIKLQQNIKNKKNREIQKILSKEIVSIIYSPELVLKLASISDKLFNDYCSLSQDDFELIEGSIPTAIINPKETCDINNILKKLNFSSSASDSRRLIKDKCIFCFNKQITDVNYCLTSDDIKGKYSIIKKGKKDFGLVVNKS